MDSSLASAMGSLSMEEEQLINDLRKYRQIKIKTANILPERQMKYAQERHMQRQRLKEGHDPRRRGTADHQGQNNFERESDKFQQLRRRICQSQKGGPRSTQEDTPDPPE